MDQETIKQNFSLLETRADVADLLDIKEASLRYFLYKRRPENMYNSFEIPKKNGTSRKISAPCKELKKIQKKLANILSAVYVPKICAYGFIENKNILENAQQHLKKHQILNIDLKDFFSQIHFGRVRGMLMQKPYSIGMEAATTIAQIACYNGTLPQGAPSSPIITNMICSPLDNSLMRLAEKTNCVYTRYADDITFSTHSKSFNSSIVYIENQEIKIGEKLSATLQKHSFSINHQKITLQSKFFHQEVTGLTVNKFPNIRRNYTKQLRAILYNCQKVGIYATAKSYIEKGYCKNISINRIVNDPSAENKLKAWFEIVLKGKILYIKQIKGGKSLTYLSFAQKMNNIFCKEIFDITELSKFENLVENATCILEYDDNVNYIQGSGFYLQGYGLFTSNHVTKNDNNIFKVFSYKNYPDHKDGTISKSINELSSNDSIDYALYIPPFPLDSENSFCLGDSSQLKFGDQVTIICYPNHQKGNSPFIQSCNITSKKIFLGAPLFTISGRVLHGASGGVVLNSNNEVIGIIKAGIITLDEDEENENHGFIPIHLVIEHLRDTHPNKFQ